MAKLEWYTVISTAAVISFFVPMAIVVFRKMLADQFFVLFATYWTVGGLINLTDLMPAVSRETANMIVVFYNMLDIPFILFILYTTASAAPIRKFTTAAILMIILTEVVSVYQMGLNSGALVYALGLGIVLVLTTLIWEISRYLQKVEQSNRQNAKVLIYAAVLFEYATFIMIYISDYFLPHPNTSDSYIIYYLSTLVAIVIAACGFLIYRKYENLSFEG